MKKDSVKYIVLIVFSLATLVLLILNAFCTLWRSQMRFRAVALRSITAARF